MDNHIGSIICVSILIAFCAMVAGFTIGNVNANRLYYDSMNKCIESGGMFLPTSGQSNAVCVKQRG